MSQTIGGSSRKPVSSAPPFGEHSCRGRMCCKEMRGLFMERVVAQAMMMGCSHVEVSSGHRSEDSCRVHVAERRIVEIAVRDFY